ncbi:MAG: ATP-binding cassette domain-containing protein [Aliifodinibius sp.]|nr:ATP-binding cassette domain-containing protein [Fodinibius sp.]
MIIQLCLVPFSVFDIVLVKIITDKVITERRIDLLFPIAIIFCGVMLIVLCIEMWLQYRAICLGQFWDGTIKDRFLRSILHKPLEFFQRFSAGEILYRVLNDSAALPSYMTQMRWSFIVNLFSMIVVIALMFYLDISLSLLVLAAIPVQVWGLSKVGRKCRKIYENLKLCDQRLLGNLDNITTCAESLKAFSLENQARHDWFSDYRIRLRVERRLLVFQRLVTPLLLKINTIMAIVVICYGAYCIVTGILSMGTFIAFLIVAARFPDIVQFLANYHVGLQDIIMCCRRVRATWQALEHNIRPEARLLSKPFPVSCLSRVGNPKYLRFSKVGYAYSGDKQIFQDIDWEVPVGRVYRLQGQNGSGKSTLLKVGAGLLTPKTGQVFLNEFNIREIKSDVVRRNVIYLSSENYWFKGTIRANIYYGFGNGCYSSQKHLEELTKITGTNHLIEKLPRGFDTPVSTGGENFSSGEKQRLSLLRVLLAEPAFMFLDESLTSIHSDDAARILSEMIRYLGRDTTVIYVHHGVNFNLPQQKDIQLHTGALLNA